VEGPEQVVGHPHLDVVGPAREQAVSNERGYPPNPLPPGCLLNKVFEDSTNFPPQSSQAGVPSDAVQFANFMHFLDQPTPACTGSGCSTSIQNGQQLFISVVKCALCHTPMMTTTNSSFAPAALSNVSANLFSDLLLHHMRSGLADNIVQGGAGPDQFRTSPLWGLGQRIFLVHDVQTSDLLKAIEAHASSGSEANGVIQRFNSLTDKQKQDLLNFLRSL
jgi:Di-haem oxidoreductase, putative peroxidase